MKFIFKFNAISIHIKINNEEFFIGFYNDKYYNPDAVLCRKYDPKLIHQYDNEEIEKREEYKRLNPNIRSAYFGGLGYAFKYRDIEKCIDIKKIIELIKNNDNKLEIINIIKNYKNNISPTVYNNILKIFDFFNKKFVYVVFSPYL